jgi:hypothetical protein
MSYLIPMARCDTPPSSIAVTPTTIRLRKPAAVALRKEWLEEKRKNVLLSYPEFASEIVRLGLQAHQQRR